jgi:DNA-directed RNA polymerase specialized sigma24 family protein
MSSSPDITLWFRQLQAGDRQAVQKLWERYFHALVVLARKKLGSVPRRAADEEDVALSAFDTFVRRAEQGRFPSLEDRNDLWQVLVAITTRKAINLVVHEGRECRDWRRLQAREEGSSDSGGSLLRSLIGREPDPGFAAQVAEEFEQLLAGLPDDEVRQVVLLKMQGHTNEEIARELECSVAKVERKLQFVRHAWNASAADP